MLKSDKRFLTNMQTFLVMVFLMFIIFLTNFINLDGVFKNFQKDSEALVIAKINNDRNTITNEGFGLSSSTGPGPYKSCVGLQGFFYSFLANKLKLSKIIILNFITALFSAITLVILCNLLAKKYNSLFGYVFYGVCILSFWIVAFARNLYWVEYLWFLPAIFSLLMLDAFYQKKKWWFYLILLYLSILAKALCGYEYMTTILLFAISFPVIDLFLVTDKKIRARLFLLILLAGVLCLIAFFTAILIHANMRGDSIVDGLKAIWHEDVLRRTLGGNPDDFPVIYKESINSSTAYVLMLYIYKLGRPVILGIEGYLFPLLITICSFILLFNTILRKKLFSLENMMFVFYFITSISWLVLGKSHSYIHQHINYVVWYFGFVQVCMYICLDFILNQLSPFLKYLKNLQFKNSL